MAAYNVLETQFQMFIMNRDYLNDEYVAMTHSYFIQYTQQAILEFRDTLIQHLESVKKSMDERVQLKRETESKEHDTSSRSWNDAHDDGADIRPIYDEEPMTEVQTTTEIDVFAIGQQHTEQPEFNNEGEGFKEFSSDEQAMTSDHNSLELGLHDHINEHPSSKLVPDVVPLADKTTTSRQELKFLFHHHITMLRMKMEILLEPSSNKLLVVSVIPEPIVLSPIPKILTVTPATTLPPPLSITTIKLVQKQTTSIPTPPITTKAPSVTTTIPDPLPSIVQRVSV
nr:hypothetical protein [Tanacetum cinerariifolium]